MKTFLKANITLIFLIIFLFIAFVYVNAQENVEWEVLNLGYGSMESMEFINENTGWIAGLATLLKTEDGGQTCDNIQTDINFFEIDFINDSSGWATAIDNGKINILKSKDGDFKL